MKWSNAERRARDARLRIAAYALALIVGVGAAFAQVRPPAQPPRKQPPKPPVVQPGGGGGRAGGGLGGGGRGGGGNVPGQPPEPAPQPNPKPPPKTRDIALEAADALKESRKAAEKALTKFPKLVTAANCKSLGFESAEEVRSASLGAGIPVFWVPLDKLRSYKSDAQPVSLLQPTQKVIYPIKLSDQVRSSITTERLEDEWDGTSWGAPALGKLLDSARAKHGRETRTPLNSYFAVHVPALNVYFIARPTGVTNAFELIPVLDEPKLGLKAGTTLSADKAFSQLVREAEKHDGKPR